MNSERVLAFSRNSPSMVEVTVVAPSFCTPRIVMHMCLKDAHVWFNVGCPQKFLKFSFRFFSPILKTIFSKKRRKNFENFFADSLLPLSARLSPFQLTVHLKIYEPHDMYFLLKLSECDRGTRSRTKSYAMSPTEQKLGSCTMRPFR